MRRYEGDAFSAPLAHRSASLNIFMHGGKGFGGGEATRDPQPTLVDPDDPKGKQQAIHKAETFAEYLAKRESAPASPSAPTATRDAAATTSVKPAATISLGQGLVIGGGTIGILYAAFCTSTGSPPTGLAVALTAVAFMAIGASITSKDRKA